MDLDYFSQDSHGKERYLRKKTTREKRARTNEWSDSMRSKQRDEKERQRIALLSSFTREDLDEAYVFGISKIPLNVNSEETPRDEVNLPPAQSHLRDVVAGKVSTLIDEISDRGSVDRLVSSFSKLLHAACSLGKITEQAAQAERTIIAEKLAEFRAISTAYWQYKRLKKEQNSSKPEKPGLMRKNKYRKHLKSWTNDYWDSRVNDLRKESVNFIESIREKIQWVRSLLQ